MTNRIHLVECPRDAMQGWKTSIPTNLKIAYLNALLQVGFDTIDFGSFVSHKAIPQMADTKEVISNLNREGSRSKLLAIVANLRGAQEACAYDAIACLGFPFSISETFQQRNTNSSIEDSIGTVEKIQQLCVQTGKQLVVYISMGFGNPYGDEYSHNVVYSWAKRLASLGIQVLSLADTVGVATEAQVEQITSSLIQALPGVEIGVHLHSAPENWKEKTAAAYRAGCRRFDGALKGIGGCPMAGNALVGNMNTEWLISYFNSLGIMPALDLEVLHESLQLAAEFFV